MYGGWAGLYYNDMEDHLSARLGKERTGEAWRPSHNRRCPWVGTHNNPPHAALWTTSGDTVEEAEGVKPSCLACAGLAKSCCCLCPGPDQRFLPSGIINIPTGEVAALSPGSVCSSALPVAQQSRAQSRKGKNSPFLPPPPLHPQLSVCLFKTSSHAQGSHTPCVTQSANGGTQRGWPACSCWEPSLCPVKGDRWCQATGNHPNPLAGWY